MEKNKKTDSLQKAAKVITIIGSILMPISLFFPFITGNTGPIHSISLVGYVQLAFDKGNEYMGTDAFGWMMLVMVCLLGLFSLLSLIFSFKAKTTQIIVFTILASLVFFVIRWDFLDREVVSEYGLSWGIAYYMFIIGAVISFVGAILAKILINRFNKPKEVQNEEEK